MNDGAISRSHTCPSTCRRPCVVFVLINYLSPGWFFCPIISRAASVFKGNLPVTCVMCRKQNRGRRALSRCYELVMYTFSGSVHVDGRSLQEMTEEYLNDLLEREKLIIRRWKAKFLCIDASRTKKRIVLCRVSVSLHLCTRLCFVFLFEYANGSHHHY